MKTFRISAASKATGIPGETIRMWERRYGVPMPRRDEAGHRRYSLQQVEWLRLVGRVVERGARPSQAVTLSCEELESMAGKAARPAPKARSTPELERLITSVEHRDGTSFVSNLDACWTSRSPLRFATEIASPLMDLLSTGLGTRELDDSRVMYACRIFEDHLRARCARFVADPSAPRVLLTSAPDARAHACVRVAALLCAAEGATYVVLTAGADAAQVLHATNQMRADTVAFHTDHADPRTRAMIGAWRRALPPEIRFVMLGSHGLPRTPGIEVLGHPTEWHHWLRRMRTGGLAHAI